MRKRPEDVPGVVDNLRRIYQAINEYSRKVEKETELTGPQLWVLQLLHNAGTLRVSDLAREMYLSPATVVGILDRLEAKGLISRTRSQEDRRAVDVALTEQGKELAAKAPEVAQVMLLKGLQALPEAQFAVVVEGMQQMVRLLGAEHYAPQPLHG